MSRSRGGTSLTTRSPMRISPSLTSSRPASMRRHVDLPQPDGPTSTMNSVSLTSSEKSLTARVPPANRLDTLSKVTDAMWAYILCAHQRLGDHRGCGSAQLRGGVFRPGVVDEGAGAQLDAREVFEPVGPAVRWIELEMQVRLRPGAAISRGLVQGHDVWRRKSKVPVISARQTQQRGSEVGALAVIQVGDGRHVPAGIEVNLVRPARGVGHESDHAPVGEDFAWAGGFVRDLLAVQAPAAGGEPFARDAQLRVDQG